GKLRGSIEQFASALDGGVVVEARRAGWRAGFSGTAVNIELLVRADESEGLPAGIPPNGALLEGVAATSAHVRSDGTTVLRFPPSAWPAAPTTLALTVRVVQFIDEAGALRDVSGAWDLAIEAPEGAEAEAARAVQALEPVVVEIAGRDVAVEAFKTHAATIV